MRVRTPSELGALIRDYRTRHKLDQKSVAETVGVSRQWIVDIEKGKAGAPLGLVLRTLEALGIVLDAQQETPTSPKDKNKSHGSDAHVDINSIVARARSRPSMNRQGRSLDAKDKTRQPFSAETASAGFEATTAH